MKVLLTDYSMELQEQFNRAVKIVQSIGYKSNTHLSKIKNSTYQRFTKNNSPTIWVGFRFIEVSNKSLSLDHVKNSEEEIKHYLTN